MFYPSAKIRNFLINSKYTIDYSWLNKKGALKTKEKSFYLVPKSHEFSYRMLTVNVMIIGQPHVTAIFRWPARLAYESTFTVMNLR